MGRWAPEGPEVSVPVLAGLLQKRRLPGAGGPAAYSLAAVGVEDSTEEFHAHDGEE